MGKYAMYTLKSDDCIKEANTEVRMCVYAALKNTELYMYTCIYMDTQ